MDELITIILIAGILGIVGLFIFYVFKTYILPKKVDELAQMIESGAASLALKKLQVLAEENDRNPYLHFLLGEAHNKMNNSQEAIMEYKQALRYLESDPRVKEEVVRKKLAYQYLDARNYNEAKKEFLILTKLNPNEPENFYQVGVLFENAGMSEKALPYFMQTVKLKPNHEEANYHIGIINYNFKNIRDSKNALTETLKTNPKHYGAHYYLGQCLRNQKDLEWAIKEFDQAAKEDAWKSRAYLGKGICLFEKEAYAKAIDELEKGLIQPNNSQDIKLSTQYMIAASAEKLRDYNTAISNWEAIHSINPKFRDVSEKLQQYAEFRVHDAIKDFMIASPGKFEKICRDVVEKEGYRITDLQVISDSEVHCVAADSGEGAWRTSVKRPTTFFIIYRRTDPINEKDVRNLHEVMKSRNITRAVLMSTSEFSTQAELFSQTRPMEIMDKSKFLAHLRSVV